MIEDILKSVDVAIHSRNISVMVFKANSDNAVIQSAIMEWLCKFYFEMLVQPDDGAPQNIEVVHDEKEKRPGLTGYVLEGQYPGMHKEIALGFVAVWSKADRRGKAYHARFSMRNRDNGLRRNFSFDKEFSENDARNFSAWVYGNIIFNYRESHGASLVTPKIPL